MLNDLAQFLEPWLTTARILGIARALILLAAGFVISRIAGGAIGQITDKRLAQQQTQLFKRAVKALVFFLFFTGALHQVGFNLGVLLGAAGVLSVAVGFASQTSASNLISGLFLIAERPFTIGDVVQVNSTTGEVLSIDLLSIKLRTFDNLYVRIPNETVIKTEVRTLTRFPIRRADIKIGVSYKEDLDRVREVLMDVADANPLCLEEPKPNFIFIGFGPSSKDLQFSPWAKQENFLEMRNSLQLEIYRRFEHEGIEIPFPQVSLSRSSTTEPFEVRVVADPPREEG